MGNRFVQMVKSVKVEAVVSLTRRQKRALAASLGGMVLAMQSVVAHGAHAAGADPINTVNNFLTGVVQLLNMVAPFVLLLAFFGLAVMYLGSSIPVIGDWKKDNPRAASGVFIGLIFLLVASGAATLAQGNILQP
jgi:hypothetical protein